jgi:predicted nucleotidyltransferase
VARQRHDDHLVGFEHVFANSELSQIADGVTVKVTPPVVLMLLKLVAYMDDPARRAKDLEDIRGLLSSYESGNNERIFSDEVLAANVDFNLVPAFLLGSDLRRLSNGEEAAVVAAFLRTMDEKPPAWMAFVRARSLGDTPEEDARAQLEAFRQGFGN